MIRFYLKYAFRNIIRQKTYSLINIFGLAIGICTFLLITLYVQNEYSYDKHNSKFDRIYRMEFGEWCVIPPGYAHILDGQIPEIEKITRTFHIENMLYSYEPDMSGKQIQNITAKNTLGVDSSFFEIFDAEFISGSAETVLRDPLTIVLTESLAKQLFSNENAMNKIITLNNDAKLRINGVIKDIKNTHFNAEAYYSVTSNETLNWEGATTNLSASNYLTYFLFNKETTPSNIRTKIFKFIQNYDNGRMQDWWGSEEFIVLRPLKDIYFFKEAQFENGINHGNKPVVNSFIIIAIFILLIAGINFINLTTARASLRAKEVGIKKVAGSIRSSLVFQFLLESIMITLISMLLALTLLQILLPEFNNLALTDLKFASILNFQGIITLIIITLIIGIVSGLYPAFYLCYFNPIKVLKGEATRGKSAGTFRKILISFQFIIASILISGTFVVNQQMNFLKNKDLGFTKEQTINFRLRDGIRENAVDFKAKLLQSPNISHVSFSQGIPGSTRNTNTFVWKDEDITTRVSSVDAEFFNLYNIEVLKGSVDMWKNESKQRNFVAINETLAKEIGWKDPIGKVINREGYTYNNMMVASFKIVAVIKDYHLESLHTPVPPLALCFDDKSHFQASVKISGSNIPETLEFIEKTWSVFLPDFPFEFTFLDQEFDKMYKSEEQMQKIAIYFSVLAIFIACLGLFGLSAFMIQRRFKEIGIHKVLGASILQIIRKLSTEFTVLILIANAIAIPLSWFLLNKWLEDYPYRVEIHWWIFPIALIITFLIAIATVSFHSLKAATSNPVDAIRHE